MSELSKTLYQMAIFNFDTLNAKTILNQNVSVDLTLNSEFNGAEKLININEVANQNAQNLEKEYILAPNETFIKIEYKSNENQILKVNEVDFIDPMLERFKPLLNPASPDRRRKFECGKSLSETLGKRQVTIIRAADERTKTFKKMDYIMFHDGLISPNTYSIVEQYLLGETDLRTRQQKAVGWVASHAQTMAVSYGENHQVLLARVSTEDIYEATNPGEYFYDGDIIEGKIGFKVGEHGNYINPNNESESSFQR